MGVGRRGRGREGLRGRVDVMSFLYIEEVDGGCVHRLGKNA